MPEEERGVEVTWRPEPVVGDARARRVGRRTDPGRRRRDRGSRVDTALAERRQQCQQWRSEPPTPRSRCTWTTFTAPSSAAG